MERPFCFLRGQASFACSSSSPKLPPSFPSLCTKPHVHDDPKLCKCIARESLIGEAKKGTCRPFKLLQARRRLDTPAAAQTLPAASDSCPEGHRQHCIIPTSKIRHGQICLIALSTSQSRADRGIMAGPGALEEWATWAVSPAISAIVITLLVALTLPVLLHYYLYRQAAARVLPSFLLVGASGSGKTSLLTLVRRSHYPPPQKPASRKH